MEVVSKQRRITTDVKQAAIALVFLVGFIGDTHRNKESDDKIIVTLKFPSLSVSLSPLRFPVTFKSLRLTERQIVMTDIACTMCGHISTAGHDDFCFDDDKCQHVLCGSACMWYINSPTIRFLGLIGFGSVVVCGCHCAMIS